MTEQETMAQLASELRRMNRNLELLFGLPASGKEPALMHELEQLLATLPELKGVTLWAAADKSSQVYLCVRRGFMQPATAFPVDDLDAARAYLSGVMRNAELAR
jgi:hypothetical protein